MSEYKKEIDVPFTENSGRRCVPACTAMLLDTLMPEHSFTTEEIESLSGYREGYSTWAAQHLLSLNSLGLEVGWIQDEDLASFAQNPELYIRNQISDRASFEAFKATNDIELEAQRIDIYLRKGLSFERRAATQKDITARLLGGWVVRLEVNGKTLADQEGYAAHAVLVSGFNDDVVRLENPDGLYGPKPKQVVSWDKLHASWTEPTLQYYRRKHPEVGKLYDDQG
jgi:hypothetical protein